MRVFYLHFNRIAMQRKDAKVWSVRTSKECFHSEKVVVDCPVVTVFKNHSKNNPRAFLKGYGEGHWIEEKGGDKYLLLTNDLQNFMWNRQITEYAKFRAAEKRAGRKRHA